MINTEISPPTTDNNNNNNNNNNNTTVYVSNLADALSEDHLLQFLSCLGTIVEMKLFVPPSTPTSSSASSSLLGTNKQRIYQVTFSQETEAKSAIDVSDTVLLGHSILISHSIPSLLPPPSSSSIIASPQQQQQTTLSPPLPFHHHHHHHPLQQQQQQQQQQPFVQPLLQQHFHQPHQLSSPNSSASLTSFYPPAPSHASTTFVSNPYIRPVRNMPFAPIASTGNDEKDREIARTIYVGNINSKVSPAELVDFFSVCGPVAYIRMAGDESQPTRFAFIEFLDMDAAQMAMTMNGRMLMDRPIKINRSKNTIVKPPVKLTREEQKQLDYAVDKLSRKLQQCRQQEEAVN